MNCDDGTNIINICFAYYIFGHESFLFEFLFENICINLKAICDSSKYIKCSNSAFLKRRAVMSSADNHFVV